MLYTARAINITIPFKHSTYAAYTSPDHTLTNPSPALPTMSITFFLAQNLVPQQPILRGAPTGSNTGIIALLSHDQNKKSWDILFH